MNSNSLHGSQSLPSLLNIIYYFYEPLCTTTTISPYLIGVFLVLSTHLSLFPFFSSQKRFPAGSCRSPLHIDICRIVKKIFYLKLFHIFYTLSEMTREPNFNCELAMVRSSRTITDSKAALRLLPCLCWRQPRHGTCEWR